MTTRVVPIAEFLDVDFDSRRVGHVIVEAPGERDEWEMHPDADEFLYLLDGAIDVVLREDLDQGEERRIELRPGRACIVPKGAWHRQIVLLPCKMLFITPETCTAPTYLTTVGPSGQLR